MQYEATVPTMKDRAMQALYLLALEPIAECTADPHSYGFRPKRCAADAMVRCQHIFSGADRAQWVLEGDIKACFDNISHEWLIAHVPMDKAILHKWLKAGFMQGRTLWPTDAGTPQGGIISPAVANVALDGLETMLRQNFRRMKRTTNLDKVHLVRYADDFIISGSSRELLVNEVKPQVENFLKARGLELSQEKTSITRIEHGFDFLGWNVRRYSNGSVLAKPSKKSVLTFMRKIRALVKGQKYLPQGALIGMLNPLIRGWANYHRCAMAAKTFHVVSWRIWQTLWRWAKRRHPNKGGHWIARRYWIMNGPRWVFATRGQKRKIVKLIDLADISIQRHVKIQSGANPYDPKWEMYLEGRVQRQMKETLSGRLWKLWYRQEGRCPVCNQLITTETDWHMHHIVWRVQGGSDRLDNLALLHPDCHRQVHSLKFAVA